MIWLGIVANLALALPTLAAPEHDDRVRAAADAPRRCCGRGSPALLLILLSVFYMPAAVDLDRYRAVAWLAVGVAAGRRALLRRLPGRRIRMLGLLRPGVPRAGGILLLLAGARPNSRRTVTRRTPVSGRRRDALAWRIGCVASRRSVVLGCAPAALFVYNRFFREQPAPYFASDEDHFLFGSIGTEGRAGRAVLDLAGAAAHLSGPAARAWRLCLARLLAQGRPRDADRPLEGHGRVPARRHQLRVVPHGQLPRAARRSADDRPGRPVAPDGAAAVLPVPVRVRVRSALHRRHDPRRDRQEHPAVAARSPALSLRDHSRRRARALLQLRDAGRLDAQRGPTGAAAASIRSTR